MNAVFRNMLMCHMVADSRHELLAMAKIIGMRQVWIQKQGTYHEHFDVSDGRISFNTHTGERQINRAKSRKSVALAHGAIEVDKRGLFNVMQRTRADWNRYLTVPADTGLAQMDLFGA